MIIVKKRPPAFTKADAMTIAPFVIIDPRFINDKTLLAHEEIHYKEQIRVLTLPWWILYLLSPTFRLHAEVRAYKRQIELGGITVDLAAYFISSRYRLNISVDKVQQLLRE